MESEPRENPVEVESLKKAFGKQKVLDGVNLQVASGETLAVLGRSGTGKSVLLKLLIGLQKPDSGRIAIHGKDLATLNGQQLNELRLRIGFLFQQAALYDSLTVEDNVAFPLRRHSSDPQEKQREKVRELLESVGMQDHGNKMPSEISGGMQKRVGLARALVLDPDILLFDEPTAGLDPITSGEIDELIVELREKRKLTAIVVTHDIRGARTFAHRLVLLREGKIVAEGSFADLQQNDDRFVQQFVGSLS
ncbi:MAG TPA: ABC transporter ATP-binding protein [Bryobacteraceae bacterium]|nr:ABC transporter ATP-binding protein [Bryobacteraceae bacterium]